MSKPVIKIGVSVNQYVPLANLLNRVIANLTGNLNFTTPLPAVSALSSASTVLANAIMAWGPKGNRGSHEQLLALRAASLTAHSLLVASAAYVKNTAEIAAPLDYVAQAAIITTSGFAVRNSSSPQGVLGAVQGLHIQTGVKFQTSQPRLRWKHPLNLNSKGAVKSYLVYRGTTNVFGASTQIASVTKTAYTDTTAPAGTTLYYFVFAMNSAGMGVAAAPIMVATPVA